MLSHTSWIRISNKEWGNNMHLLIHQEHEKDSNLTDQTRTSNKEWGNNMHLLIPKEHDKGLHLIDYPTK
jgi:hypothetical protein